MRPSPPVGNDHPMDRVRQKGPRSASLIPACAEASRALRRATPPRCGARHRPVGNGALWSAGRGFDGRGPHHARRACGGCRPHTFARRGQLPRAGRPAGGIGGTFIPRTG